MHHLSRSKWFLSLSQGCSRVGLGRLQMSLHPPKSWIRIACLIWELWTRRRLGLQQGNYGV
jgi:hypothetical protein